MRVGKLQSIPNEYSDFGRVIDEKGSSYTVERGDVPKGAKVGDEFAYKVEIWGSGGLAYDLKDN
ncbi:MAG: hypothetical protein R3B45_07245 [Bdellovibrionota bacterium]